MDVPFQGARFLEADNHEIGIVLFHAYTGSTNDMNLLGRRLNKAGYNVLMPLLKGHATNDIHDILDANIEIWRRQSKEAVEWMCHHFDQVFVFGLSLGGLFAIDALIDDSLPVKAGGTFNSPIVREQTVTIDDVFKAYTRNLYKKNDQYDQFEDDWPSIKFKYTEQMHDLEMFKASYRNQLDTIKVPVLLVQSLKDTMVRGADIHEVVHAMAGVDMTLKTFPENTHVITVDRNRQSFEAFVVTFIERNSH